MVRLQRRTGGAAVSRRTFSSLDALIQDAIAGMTGQGLVVVVPSMERIDVYTPQQHGFRDADEFLRSLPWISAVRTWLRGWKVAPVDQLERERFLRLRREDE